MIKDISPSFLLQKAISSLPIPFTASTRIQSEYIYIGHATYAVHIDRQPIFVCCSPSEEEENEFSLQNDNVRRSERTTYSAGLLISNYSNWTRFVIQFQREREGELGDLAAV